jgi:hypothetical protein
VRYPKKTESSIRGQAIVETLLCVILVLGLYYGLVQLTQLGLMRIIAFDAAGASCRASVVEQSPRLAAYYVFSSQQVGITVTIPFIKSEINDNKCIVKLTYFQKVMFPEFFSLLGINMLPGTAYCRMVTPNEHKYFTKSYPDSKPD